MNQVGPVPWHDFLWKMPLWLAHDFAHESMIISGRGTRWPEQMAEEDRRVEETIRALKAATRHR